MLLMDFARQPSDYEFQAEIAIGISSVTASEYSKSGRLIAMMSTTKRLQSVSK